MRAHLYVPDGEISIDRNPHERVDGDGPESDLQIADQPANDVPVDPSSHERRIHGERHHEQTAE